MWDVGGECVEEKLCPPPFSHTKTQPPSASASCPPRRDSPHTNKHLVWFRLVDTWLLFFSKQENFMADLRRKNVLLYEIGIHMCTRAIWRHMYVCIVTIRIPSDSISPTNIFI